MNLTQLTTVIALSAIVTSHQYPDFVHLIKRLNYFYRFDHHTFFVDSSIDPNLWFQIMSLSSSGIKLDNSQIVYTFDGFYDIGFNITEGEWVRVILGKNTFLIIAAEGFENISQQLVPIEVIREFRSNIKIGVFFTRPITSLNVVEELFRWSWNTGIMNIFCAFYLYVNDSGPTFNVFKYNPFITFDLINVTRAESLAESQCIYFYDEVPNYQQHPIRFSAFRDFANQSIEMKFWDTVVRVFNASISENYVAEVESVWLENEDVDLFRHETLYRKPLQGLYPFRQTTLLMIVPHAQPYSDFTAYLQNGTWTLLFIYMFIVIATSSILLFISGYLQKSNISIFQCVTDVVNLLINDNGDIRYQGLHRADVFVTVPLTFTGLVVMNGVVSVFQSFITSPIYQPQINSLKDLHTSSVTVLVNEIGWRDEVVALLENLSNLDEWSGKVQGISMAQLAKEVRTFNNSIAFVTLDYDVQVVLEVQKRLSLKAFYALNEITLSSYLVSYQHSSGFPFLQPINDIIHRLNSGGLIKKWVEEHNEFKIIDWWKRRLQAQYQITTESDVGKFSVPTAVWCGWIASGIVFVCEVIWGKVKSYLAQKR